MSIEAMKQEPVAWVREHELPLAPGDAFSWVETFVHKTPLYTTPPAARQWVGLMDEDREILEAVRREMDEDDDGNAPGHGHRIPGIWDEDNGDLAGKPCAWCLTWAKFTALIEREKNGGQA